MVENEIKKLGSWEAASIETYRARIPQIAHGLQPLAILEPEARLVLLLVDLPHLVAQPPEQLVPVPDQLDAPERKEGQDPREKGPPEPLGIAEERVLDRLADGHLAPLALTHGRR